jgi:hypothetical protein
MDRVGLRIAGNDIEQFYEQTSYSVEVSQFLEEIKAALVSNKFASELLPRGCRFYDDAGLTRRYVMEMPPNIVPFKWDRFYIEDDDQDVEGGLVEVAVPWQYFVFIVDRPQENPFDVQGIFREFKLFWSQDRLNSLYESRMNVAWLPNINQGTGLVCLGGAVPESNGLVADRIESIVGDFFQSTFNGDLGWDANIPYNDPYLWAIETKKNPTCWTNWTFPTSRARFYEWMNIDPYNRGVRLNNRSSLKLLNDAMARAASRGPENYG